ncbi:CD151 antigen-like isoform X1 [Centruroides sculpturatus]|uniref:CD151 antigen-like isoform X1 n=1 Tax=Centruroides sculpturatus TaxID=218467 RepID=UPI000C6DCA4B|nr:CD151 antigen-like isoform X1 [Centruroides sculpturatus]
MVNQTQCLRICVFLFSAVNWSVSIVVLFYYALTQSDDDIIEVMVNNISYRHSFVLLLSCSILVTFFGVIGCWGALDIERVALCLYTVASILIIALQILTLILLFDWKKTLEGDIKNFTRATVTRYYSEEKSTVSSKAMDVTQRNFECCGERDYLDWVGSKWWREERRRNGTAVVPLSCCVRDNFDACNTGLPPYRDVFFKLEIYIYVSVRYSAVLPLWLTSLHFTGMFAPADQMGRNQTDSIRAAEQYLCHFVFWRNRLHNLSHVDGALSIRN